MTVTDSAIIHDGIAQNGFKQPKFSNVSQISISQVDSTESLSQVSIPETSARQINSFQTALGQITLAQISLEDDGATKISFSNNGIGQVSIAQNDASHLTGQSRIAEISPIQVDSIHYSIPQFSTTQIGISQFSTTDITTDVGTTQVDVSQLSSSEIFRGMDRNIREISLPSSITLQQFLSSHNFNLQNTTIPTWTEFLTGTTPFNLNIAITDLPTGQLAEANITHFDPSGRPTSGTLTLDTDANGLGWFIDRTPWDNAEFGTVNSDTLYRATLGSEAYGRYDLLTTILHELGHLAGLISGTPTYDDRVTNISGTPTFQGNGYNVALTADRSHLTDPTKLMSTYLAPGMRKLPSQLELQMLTDIRNSSSTRGAIANSSARQEATPMLGITNGQFDQLLDQWDTRGSIQVTNANLTLREDDPLLANLSQTFIIPQVAKTLQFTLTDAYLDQSPLNPGDTFEVALLSFDLLGFGSQNGYVTIDDVRRFTDNNTPIALLIAKPCRQKSPCPTTI